MPKAVSLPLLSSDLELSHQDERICVPGLGASVPPDVHRVPTSFLLLGVTKLTMCQLVCAVLTIPF
jgi:hypothetical protein